MNKAKNPSVICSVLLLPVLLMVAAAAHEVSHITAAGALGYEANIVYSQWGLPIGMTLHSFPTAINAVLIVLAGGMGASVFLLVLWRIFHVGLLAFAFVISAQLSYAFLETLWYFGFIGAIAASFIAVFVGACAVVTAIAWRQGRTGGGFR